jgi:hypothetical protein
MIEFIVRFGFGSYPSRGVHFFVRRRGKVRLGAQTGCQSGADPLVPPTSQQTGGGLSFSGPVEKIKRCELEATIRHRSSPTRKLFEINLNSAAN